jgi:hypothetical protein
MDVSNIPKPLVYSMSIVLLAIGLGVAYQVVDGSDLSYDGPLGAIKVGSGEDQTTLEQFLGQSETALKGAQETISEQESLIVRLKATVAQYKNEVVALKALSAKLSVASSNASRSRLNSDIDRKVAALSASALKVSQLKQTPQLQKTRASLVAQAALTRDVKAKISKEYVSKKFVSKK